MMLDHYLHYANDIFLALIKLKYHLDVDERLAGKLIMHYKTYYHLLLIMHFVKI